MNNINENDKMSKKVVLSIVSVGMLAFIDIMLEMALNVDFPTLMKIFNVNSGTVQWLTSGVILVSSILVILSPWLKENFTYKHQFYFANIASIIGIFIDATATNFPMVLIGRLLQGFGAGIGLTSAYNIVFEQIPKKHRGMMVGFVSLIISFAPAFGPAFGGFVTATLGWQYIFWLSLPVPVISLILGYFTITQTSPLKKTKLDVFGWINLSIIFVLGILFFPILSESGILNIKTISTLIGIILLIYIYIRHAKTVPNPLIEIHSFKNLGFSLASAAQMLMQITVLMFNYAIPMFLQIVLLISTQQVGLSLMPAALMYAASTIISGREYDKRGQGVLKIGMVIMSVSIISFIFLPKTFAFITIAFILLQTGSGWWMGNNMTNTISRMPAEDQSTGNSIFNTISNYSAALGVDIAAGIINSFQKNATTQKGIVDQTYNGYITVVFVAAIFIFLVVLFSSRTISFFSKNENI